LSNGDYRDVSDGPVRTKELNRACSLIGLIEKKSSVAAAAAAVVVLDDNRMKDGPNEVWNSDLIAATVLEHLQEMISNFIVQQQQSQITVNIITFDEGGVSGHPNHMDVFRGVRHFLHEKCRGSDKKNSMTRVKLKQQTSSSTVTDNGRNVSSSHSEVNIRVFTLETLSNPLHKYFLWIFVEFIPILLFQLLSYTIHFLLGGLFFIKKGQWGSLRFSRMNTTSDGKQIQCRLFDPVLVWMAMAAHHSQFVWYRRLSVLFSRYTYLNDLHELTIDTSLFNKKGEEEDETEDTLLPVKTIEEEMSSPQFLLSTAQMTALREAVLPIGLHHRPWKRIYSLSRDGDSFISFEKHIADWNAKLRDHSTLLVVKTTKGEIIGGYADAIATSSPRPGTARSCLFRAENDGTFTVYGKQNSVGSFEGSPERIRSGGAEGYSKKILLDSSRRIIAFGGGIGMKSGEGFGLSLEDGFARGTTARCEAFCNEPLVEGNGGVFDVLDVEVWGFVFGQF
jgi:N-acetylglucosaminylphosphatidylinositol deacetylase